MESFPPVRSDFLFFFFDRSKAADDVVSKRGKFEQVMVASKEIAASSMQLVMASRVKADKESEKLANLNAAAKTISTLTGTVLATAESCRDKVTEAGKFSFFFVSLSQFGVRKRQKTARSLSKEWEKWD